MGISFCALLVFQLRYFEQMLRLHREQFNSSVERSLTHVTRQLEMDETMKALRADVASNLPDTVQLATDPMLQGGSLGIHQDLLTASAETTQIYATMADESKRESVNRITLKPRITPQLKIVGQG